MQRVQVNKPGGIQDDIIGWIISAHHHDPPISQVATCRPINILWRRHLLCCPAIGCHTIAIDGGAAVFLFRIGHPTQQDKTPVAIRSKHGVPYSDRQWCERCPLILCDVVSIPARTRRCMGTEPVHVALREKQMALLVGDHGTAISKGDGSRRRNRLYIPRSRLVLV